jgi:hypothetical protein
MLPIRGGSSLAALVHPTLPDRRPAERPRRLWTTRPRRRPAGHHGRVPAPSAAAPTHPLARWLRARVIALRAETRCRVFPATVELVPPDAGPGTGPLASWAYGDEPTDHGLRVDVLARLFTDCRCRGAPGVTLVHVRSGRHDPSDADLGWAAAAATAADIGGVGLGTVVVLSRWGWRDLVSGAERCWLRPRDRPRRTPADPG